MKKILFDINHPCDINLFKYSICQLAGNKDFDISITYLLRNPVPVILKKELPDIKKKAVGKHRGTIPSILLEANIIKFFRLFIYVLKYRPDLCISFGSFILGAVCKMLRITNIQFYDDPENKKNLTLQKITADQLFYPIFFDETAFIKKFNALKEWAYLSPDYFIPNSNSLISFNVTPKNYIFIREVSTKTTNYIGQQSNSLCNISEAIPKSYKVILSLEDKSKRFLYPPEWIILEEPLEDIYSLIYYSTLLISSGDSMAREGALLGVPSIYAGDRIMQANKYLEDMGLLIKVSKTNINNYLKEYFTIGNINSDQEIIREKLYRSFEDLNKFIIDLAYCAR